MSIKKVFNVSYHFLRIGIWFDLDRGLGRPRWTNQNFKPVDMGGTYRHYDVQASIDMRRVRGIGMRPVCTFLGTRGTFHLSDSPNVERKPTMNIIVTIAGGSDRVLPWVYYD